MQTNFLPKPFFHVLLIHLSWRVYSFLLLTYYKNSKKTNKPWIIALGDDAGMCSRHFAQAFPWLAEVEDASHLAKPNWFALTIFTFWCFQPVFKSLQFVHPLPEWYCIMPDSPAISSFRFTGFDPACHGLSFFLPNPTTFHCQTQQLSVPYEAFWLDVYLGLRSEAVLCLLPSTEFRDYLCSVVHRLSIKLLAILNYCVVIGSYHTLVSYGV